jgi:hypothetical protein
MGFTWFLAVPGYSYYSRMRAYSLVMRYTSNMINRAVEREHAKRIKRAKRTLDRTREAMIMAEMAYRETICDGFAAGLTVKPIHTAAGISVARCYQIKRSVRR